MTLPTLPPLPDTPTKDSTDAEKEWYRQVAYWYHEQERIAAINRDAAAQERTAIASERYADIMAENAPNASMTDAELVLSLVRCFASAGLTGQANLAAARSTAFAYRTHFPES